MKKFLLTFIIGVISLMCYAQGSSEVSDVTTFLGIPVDGSKEVMKQKLIDKGFVPGTTDSGIDYLRGEFNGREVMVVIVTYKEKVYRVYVTELKGHRGMDIKARFNTLVCQFERNKNYMEPQTDQMIPYNVDVAFEMLVKEHRFIAEFFQKENDMSNLQHNKRVWFMIDKMGSNFFIVMYYDNELNKPNGDDL